MKSFVFGMVALSLLAVSNVGRRVDPPPGEKHLADIRQVTDGLIEPHAFEIMLMAADGSGKRQGTANGNANFAPFSIPMAVRSFSHPTWMTRRAAISISF